MISFSPSAKIEHHRYFRFRSFDRSADSCTQRNAQSVAQLSSPTAQKLDSMMCLMFEYLTACSKSGSQRSDEVGPVVIMSAPSCLLSGIRVAVPCVRAFGSAHAQVEIHTVPHFLLLLDQ